jgi:hypothetical protein
MGIGERRWTGPGLNGDTCYPLLSEWNGLHTGNDRKEGGGKAVRPYQKCAATACCVVVRAPQGPFVQLTPDVGAVRRQGWWVQRRVFVGGARDVRRDCLGHRALNKRRAESGLLQYIGTSSIPPVS